VLKSVCCAPFLQWSVQLQIVLSIRSFCSLPTMVCVTVSNIVRQVALLPSFTGNLHCCKSGCSALFLQQWGHSQLTLLTACSNLFQFILIYLNLFWIYLNFVEFLSEKQSHVTKLLGQFWVSSHHLTCDTAYILDEVFIWASGPSWTLY